VVLPLGVTEADEDKEADGLGTASKVADDDGVIERTEVEGIDALVEVVFGS
jgi:hypothetical protein